MDQQVSRPRTGMPWWARVAFGIAAVVVAVITR